MAREALADHGHSDPETIGFTLTAYCTTSEEAMPFNYANEDGGGMNKSLFFQIMDEVFAGSMYKDIEDKYGSEIAKEYLKYGDDNGHFEPLNPDPRTLIHLSGCGNQESA